MVEKRELLPTRTLWTFLLLLAQYFIVSTSYYPRAARDITTPPPPFQSDHAETLQTLRARRCIESSGMDGVAPAEEAVDTFLSIRQFQLGVTRDSAGFLLRRLTNGPTTAAVTGRVDLALEVESASSRCRLQRRPFRLRSYLPERTPSIDTEH